MSGKIGTDNPSVDIFSIYGKRQSDGTRSGIATFNLGTGTGSSVLEVIQAFERACNHKLNYEICERRPGDIATCYADCSKAFKELE